MANVLLDRELIAEIRRIEQSIGRNDVLSGFVRTLESKLADFGAAFSDHLARGDAVAAARAAHTLKGACHQLGAKALGELFDAIERCTKTGDFAEAKRKFESSAGLIADSLEALKRA
jgi:HPt (histidine-containing phosphotransfer) domain-containing protein